MLICRTSVRQAEFSKESVQEFRKATKLAQEDERVLGTVPTQDKLQLVRRYMCVNLNDPGAPRGVVQVYNSTCLLDM